LRSRDRLVGVSSEYQLTFEESASKDDLKIASAIKDESSTKVEASVEMIIGKTRSTIKPRESVLLQAH
jgi:hypothetical protein